MERRCHARREHQQGYREILKSEIKKMSLWKKTRMQCLALCAALALSMPALPQGQTQNQGQAPPVIKSEVTLVNLFATVRDKNKHVITDLKQDDFKIFEDNHEEKVAFFSKDMALPITLGMLLDTSLSEQSNLGAIQDAGSRFLHRVLRKGDEAMVISFDTDVDLLADLTDDRQILDRGINKARVNISGGGMIAGNPGPVGGQNEAGTVLYDAIYLACAEKLNGEAGRKAIIIVTDADDTGSKVKLEEAIEAAQRTDTVIHILLVIDPRYGGNPGVARKLTDETGGRVIFVRSEKNIEEAFDQISEELRSQYTLGYYPTNNAKDGKFRKIKVETNNSDLKVLARKGYYAPRS
jgi:VWFA-related protein